MKKRAPRVQPASTFKSIEEKALLAMKLPAKSSGLTADLKEWKTQKRRDAKKEAQGKADSNDGLTEADLTEAETTSRKDSTDSAASSNSAAALLADRGLVDGKVTKPHSASTASAFASHSDSELGQDVHASDGVGIEPEPESESEPEPEPEPAKPAQYTY